MPYLGFGKRVQNRTSTGLVELPLKICVSSRKNLPKSKSPKLHTTKLTTIERFFPVGFHEISALKSHVLY
jgi:hypothetical protein